jgi:hypothetical protein
MIKVQTTLVAGPRNQRYLHPRSVGAGVPIFTVIIALEFKRSLQLFALAAAILALGAVYWLVRDQDRSIERDQSAQHHKLRRQSSP